MRSLVCPRATADSKPPANKKPPEGGSSWLRRKPQAWPLMTCWSSPDSYMSIMMSEPPMNSPRTYSCGMVGQLLYSLMPWRISASSSTFTVLRVLVSTPQALRICTARPEKPHMGKLALPFMNSRMSLPLTSSSMRCWVSLMGRSSFKSMSELSLVLQNPVHQRGSSGLLCPGAAFDAGQILTRLDVLPACRSEEHTSELQSHHDLVCRLLLEKKK